MHSLFCYILKIEILEVGEISCQGNVFKVILFL